MTMLSYIQYDIPTDYKLKRIYLQEVTLII